MRTLACVLLLCCLTTAAGATDVVTYDVRFDARADGTGRAVVAIELDRCVPGVIELPLGFAESRDVRLTRAPEGASITTSRRNGQSIVLLTLPEGAPSSVTVAIELAVAQAFVDITPAPGEKSTLPAGARILRHAMLNTSPETIGVYRATVTFPDGLRAHAVREQLPKLRKGEAGPRATLTAVDGRRGAKLEVEKLAQGNTAVMQIELVPAKRSPGWLIAGAALAILYLVYFKDLVSARPE